MEAMAGRESFDEFYAGAVGRLVGQLFPVTGDLHEAEEVVQEAFTRAAARWSRLRDDDVPEAWARQVAMHLVADWAGSLRRQQLPAVTRAGPMAGQRSPGASRPGPPAMRRQDRL
jgi:RNA polymerase sigma-70 factor, ECF subfamily